MSEIFRWDPAKAATNERNHGVSFWEAVEALLDPAAITEFDEDRSAAESRFHTIGMSGKLRVLLVVHAERDDAIRIISARKATRAERERYEQQRR